MEPIVLALASNERYFPGLYCAVASALRYLDRTREVNLRVLDGGISQTSRDTFSKLIDRVRGVVRLEFITVNPSVFGKATLGPGRSHMTYCRLLLPHLLDVPRLIYLDCDVLVLRDLAQLFDLELAPGKVLAAARDSETLSLADDSPTIADAINLPREGAYFNCGVTLMNLDALREQHFFQRSIEFLNSWSGKYRFWDQSAINFLLHGQIDELPEYWNRASWRFDAQRNNDLDCVLHYTTSAPWLGGTPGPAQVLFERFAADAGLPVNRRSPPFRTSARQSVWRNALAPLRALAFPIAWLWYRLIRKPDKSAAYGKVARYWLDYVYNTPSRRRLHRQRSREISTMKFDLGTSPLASFSAILAHQAALFSMDPVVLAMASNERYFPGLYCTVASALNHLDAAREVDLKVLDGGMSQQSRDALSRLIDRAGGSVRLEFVAVDPSMFRGANLKPGQSPIAYCRILLPRLLDVPRLIYLDSDVLVFRDLAELYDFKLPLDKAIAAVRDSQTLSLADDSREIAHAMKLPAEGAYFNSGVMLMNLDELRRQHFAQRSVEFLRSWGGKSRFRDQPPINFLLHGLIDELPEHWNRASWRFDAQQNNDLGCLLHYTSSAPWLVETAGPAQVLFERFAAEVGLPVNRRSPPFRKSMRRRSWRSAVAPLRAFAFPIASLWYRLIGKPDKSAAYGKVARYWLDYVYNTQSRRRLHRQRSREISTMKFDLRTSRLA